MRRVWIVLNLGVMACGGSRAPAPPSPAAPPKTVAYAPGQSRYRAAISAHVERTYGGQVSATTLQSQFFVSVTLDTAGDSLQAILNVDSAAVTGGVGGLGPDRPVLRGRRFSSAMGRSGALADLDTDSLPPEFAQLAARLRDFFPRLPSKGLVPNQAWTDTAEYHASTDGADVTVRAINQHQSQAWVDRAGVRAIPVTTETSYTLSGQGMQGGQPFTVDGQGHRRALAFLSAGGRYLGETAVDSSTVSLALTSLGMTLPIAQARVDTVAILP